MTTVRYALAFACPINSRPDMTGMEQDRQTKRIFFAGNLVARWRERNLVDKVRTRLVSHANPREVTEVAIPVWREREKK